MRLLFPLLLPVLLACGGGDDGDGGTCGLATVEGSVMGTQVTPVRAALVPAGANFQVVIDEVAGAACGDPGLTGEHLVILFCDRPTTKTYNVVGDAFSCPGGDAYAGLERNGATEYAKASAGSVTIESSGTCVQGNYALTFGSESLSGTFDAVKCQ